MKRTTTLIVSAALLAPAQLAATPAEAVSPRLTAAVTAAPTAAKATRNVTIKGVNKGRKVWVKGRVSGGYANKRVIILKRKCTNQGCSMVVYSRVRTNGESRYEARVRVPDKGKVKYQAKVKASGGYAVSFSPKITLWWG